MTRIEKIDGSAERMALAIAKANRDLRAAFMSAVSFIRDSRTIDQIERLLIDGRFEQALAEATAAFTAFADSYVGVIVVNGAAEAAIASQALPVFVAFDQTNVRAVKMITENRLRLIREFTAAQRSATRAALIDGIERGINPRQMARAFRDSIGLTAHQERAVQNFRRLLIEGDRAALSRKLRDRRFDPSIRRMLDGGSGLSSAQIERMVGRYRERSLAHRATTIARTEGLRSTHQGSELLFEQLVDEGRVQADEVEGTWDDAGDDRVRDFESGAQTSHKSMNGQTRPIGVPFTSGAGSSLMYPGDPNGPAFDTISCRCLVLRRFKLPS